MQHWAVSGRFKQKSGKIIPHYSVCICVCECVCVCTLLVLLGLLLYVIVIPLNEEVGMSLPPLLQTTYQMPSSLHTSHKHFILMPSPTDHPGQTFGCTVLLIPAEESPSAANVIELLCVFCEQKDKCSTAIEIPILHLPPNPPLLLLLCGPDSWLFPWILSSSSWSCFLFFSSASLNLFQTPAIYLSPALSFPPRSPPHLWTPLIIFSAPLMTPCSSLENLVGTCMFIWRKVTFNKRRTHTLCTKTFTLPTVSLLLFTYTHSHTHMHNHRPW